MLFIMFQTMIYDEQGVFNLFKRFELFVLFFIKSFLLYTFYIF